jgi:hypothetical protein
MGIIGAWAVSSAVDPGFHTVVVIDSIPVPATIRTDKNSKFRPPGKPARRTLDARHSYGQDLAGMLPNGPSVFIKGRML